MTAGTDRTGSGDGRVGVPGSASAGQDTRPAGESNPLPPSTEPTTTCDECGLTYFYAPRYHECAHKGDPALRAQAEALVGSSWVDECMAKQYGPREGR